MNTADKPIVFVIMPFSEEHLALYNELEEKFKDQFKFTNAGDLDNQQNIIQDIVEGIHKADIVIADLTGLNPNVFYELGLAHAMNKKVIIITQDIDELPFDIKSYRANQYSLQFNELPKLIAELQRLLLGAVNGSVKYGNPVSDYAPDFYDIADITRDVDYISSIDKAKCAEEDIEIIDGDERGLLDYTADIEENLGSMTEEVAAIGNEMNQMNESINEANGSILHIQAQNQTSSAVVVRNVCRKLAEPIDLFSSKLKEHIDKIYKYWDVVENCYLSLLDSQYYKKTENFENLQESVSALPIIQVAMKDTNEKIEGFIIALQSCRGMERRLNKAIISLIYELESYLSMTQMMDSSIDRILCKSEIIGIKI